MSQIKNNPKLQRLYSLDVFRGVAALIIVFWHWRHFLHLPQAANVDATTPASALLPLYGVFSLFYDWGWIMVDLFFALSGFIFYLYYSASITARKTSKWNFFILRLSRLYPLHLLTFFIVAGLQWYYIHLEGQAFIYQNNGLDDMFWNLTLLTSWLPQVQYSFNGPTWSVSVEAAMYVLFFFACLLLPLRLTVTLVIAALGYCLLYPVHKELGRGMGAFFLGGVYYFFYVWCMERGNRQSFRALLALALVLASTVVVYLPDIAAQIEGMPYSRYMRYGILILFVFPGFMLYLALLETSRGAFGKRFAFLGDISYAVYLLHFPLQLMLVIIMSKLQLGADIFNNAWMLFGFYTVMILVSLVCYYYFELPMQNLMRKRFMRR